MTAIGQACLVTATSLPTRPDVTSLSDMQVLLAACRTAVKARGLDLLLEKARRQLRVQEEYLIASRMSTATPGLTTEQRSAAAVSRRLTAIASHEKVADVTDSPARRVLFDGIWRAAELLVALGTPEFHRHPLLPAGVTKEETWAWFNSREEGVEIVIAAALYKRHPTYGMTPAETAAYAQARFGAYLDTVHGDKTRNFNYCYEPCEIVLLKVLEDSFIPTASGLFSCRLCPGKGIDKSNLLHNCPNDPRHSTTLGARKTANRFRGDRTTLDLDGHIQFGFDALAHVDYFPAELIDDLSIVELDDLLMRAKRGDLVHLGFENVTPAEWELNMIDRILVDNSPTDVWQVKNAIAALYLSPGVHAYLEVVDVLSQDARALRQVVDAINEAVALESRGENSSPIQVYACKKTDCICARLLEPKSNHYCKTVGSSNTIKRQSGMQLTGDVITSFVQLPAIVKRRLWAAFIGGSDECEDLTLETFTWGASNPIPASVSSTTPSAKSTEGFAQVLHGFAQVLPVIAQVLQGFGEILHAFGHNGQGFAQCACEGFGVVHQGSGLVQKGFGFVTEGFGHPQGFDLVLRALVLQGFGLIVKRDDTVNYVASAVDQGALSTTSSSTSPAFQQLSLE